MQSAVFRRPVACATLLFPLVAVVEYKLIPVAMAVTFGAAAFEAWPWKLRFWPPLIALLGLLLAWSLASAAWSIDPGHSLARFGRLALTVAAGVLLCQLAALLASGGRNDVERWFAGGILIASAVVAFRQIWLQFAPTGSVAGLLREMPVTAYNSLAALFLLVLLAAFGTRPVSRLSIAAVLAAVASIALGGSMASVAALAVGLAVWAAVLWLGRKAVLSLAVALPVVFLALPLSLEALDLPAHLKERGWTVGGSTGHRMIIWRYVSDKVEERPLLGVGLHAARLLPDRENRANDDPRFADIFAVTWFDPKAKVELMPLHPHNATWQLLLELGAVGAVLYAALYALLLFALLRMPLSRGALAGGAGGVAGAFVIGQLSFNVWQSWWLCAQFLVVALYILAARRAAGPRLAPAAGPSCQERRLDSDGFDDGLERVRKRG